MKYSQAEEIAYYAVRGTDRDPIKDVEKVRDMINQFALHIAEQAVGGIKKECIDDLHDAGWNGACNTILSRIKTLTQTNENK